MPRRKAVGRKPQHKKQPAPARVKHAKPGDRITYAAARAEAERFYSDAAYRDSLPWSEVAPS